MYRKCQYTILKGLSFHISHGEILLEVLAYSFFAFHLFLVFQYCAEKFWTKLYLDLDPNFGLVTAMYTSLKFCN